MATSRLLVLFGLISLVSAVPTSSTKQPFRVWHFTDVHVDPWYAPGSDAAKCYCETYTTCPRMGKSCGLTTNTSAAAPQFGSSEGNCATPVPLYQSALDFVSSGNAGPIDMIYFTGDFAEAGASYACSGSEKEPGPIAERQILDIINSDWHGLKESFPEKALGCLGNHDSSPGDLFFGADRQSWLYDNLTALWASELDHNPSALLTLKRGGYYATRPVPGLTVIALNVNYWAKQNPQSGIHNSSAYLEGQRQFEFLNASLQDAASVGDTIHILGHQPPYQPGGSLWQPGFWKRYMDICAPHSARIAVHLYGHIHTDQWSITRSCDDAGCASEAVGVLIPGPSLTEGYPATNPSLRIIDFDADTFALMEIHTYTADLHKANQQGKLEWELEYAMTDVLGTKGLSPSDFAAGVAAMAQDGSAAWDRYKGMGNGGLFCGGYSSDTAPFVPANPCEKCEGTCKEEWIASLNGTSLPV